MLEKRFQGDGLDRRNLHDAGRLALLALVGCAALACGSERTKTHDGVEITLLSITRMDSMSSMVELTRAVDPEDELAVVQVQFRDSGKNSIRLPAGDCEITDEAGRAYHTNMDMELTFGSGDQVMVWDFLFAVPKSAVLRSVRLGATTFALAGVRDLDPETRVTPGRHERQTR
jgi:hypothetical protein